MLPRALKELKKRAKLTHDYSDLVEDLTHDQKERDFFQQQIILYEEYKRQGKTFDIPKTVIVGALKGLMEQVDYHKTTLEKLYNQALDLEDEVEEK